MNQLVSLLLVLAAVSAQAKDCTYSFDLEKSVVEGTGYKFTEKKGVTAKFVSFETNKKAEKSVDKLLEGLRVTVDLMSIDSGNVLRDKNMREAFFAFLKGDSKAIVDVKSIKGDQMATSLTVNEVAKDVTFKYSKKDLTLTAEGSFDLANHSGNSALESLARRCKALHTGSDGKSKTWSDFALKVTAVVAESCK